MAEAVQSRTISAESVGNYRHQRAGLGPAIGLGDMLDNRNVTGQTEVPRCWSFTKMSATEIMTFWPPEVFRDYSSAVFSNELNFVESLEARAAFKWMNKSVPRRSLSSSGWLHAVSSRYGAGSASILRSGAASLIRCSFSNSRQESGTLPNSAPIC